MLKNIFNMCKEKWEEWRVSENKLYFLIQNKSSFILIFAILAFILGLVGYYKSDVTNGFLDVINNAIGLFAFSWPTDNNIWLDFAKLFAIMTVFLGVISIFFKSLLDKFVIMSVQGKPYTLLIGLGEQNSSFLKNTKKDKLIIESDLLNSNIEYFKSKNLAVIAGKAEEEIEKLNFDNIINVIISTGGDRKNIAFARQLIKKLGSSPKEIHRKIYLRIDNRNMGLLVEKNIIEHKDNIDILVHSMYENMAKELFTEHSILGLQSDIVKTKDAYSIVLIGSSSLSLELIYHIAILANLPEENVLNLFLVDNDAGSFYKRVKKLFPSIEQIPTLKIHPMEMDDDTLSFYTDDIWSLGNLTNIIIATESSNKNLDIALSLQDISYREETVTGTFETKILLAMYHDYGLKDAIKEDQATFANFYSFANIEKVSGEDILINEKLDFIAKLIHNSYLGEENILVSKLEEINKGWMEISPHKRASNRAQAMHMDMKLAALGLVKKQVDPAVFEQFGPDRILKCLLRKNKKIFNATKVFSDNTAKHKDFPKEFKTLLQKLARSEHNRWNAFHFLNGWTYSKNGNDNTKKHDCLIPFEKFNKKQEETYKYDIDAVLNIPIYLAHAGFKLEKI